MLPRLVFTAVAASLLAVSCQSPRSPVGPNARVVAPRFTPQRTNLRRFDASIEAARSGFEAFKVIKTSQGQTWPRMELLRTQGLPTTRMPERGRQQAPDVVSCFGTDRPPSTDVCLHDAGMPDTLKHKTPVLLVHGANMNATSNWAKPPFTRQSTGLMQYLRQQGYHVFAVSFADKHDDNFVWVNQIHNAIARIKQITKAEKVDAIAHSKGGFALRMYTSDIMGPGMQRPYKKSVRKALFIGTPHRGLDYTFRNSVVHWALLPAGDDPVKYAPVVWSKALLFGSWKDTREESFEGPHFKGQAQMLARWDKTYPINPSNPDWYTTYNGGQGFVSKSPGIDKIIRSSGDIVSKLKQSPVNADIQVGVLAGKRANMEGLLNESSGPSDGIVFVKSAGAHQDLTAGGARLLDSKVLNLHHLGLVAEPEALQWVDTQLRR